MNKVVITILTVLVGIIMSLSGWLYVGLCDTDKRLDKTKANEATVQVILLQIQKSQEQYQMQQKELIQRQDQINQKNDAKWEKNQEMLIKIIEKQ